VRIAEALSLAEQSGFPMWVSVDAKKMEGTLKSWPDRSDFNQEVNESLIVELYSR
jgi:small subunit ribosomal protein S4